MITSISYLPAPLLALLALALSVVHAQNTTCYVNAYGVVAKETGWVPCDTESGGFYSCCIAGAACGSDGFCHTPDYLNPGNNSWYTTGCTDPTFQAASCVRYCGQYSTIYVQYNTTAADWNCCGDAGCNGSVTDTTFAGVSPADWQPISSLVTTSTSTTSSASSTTSSSSSPTSASATTTPSSSPTSTSNPNNGGLSTGAEAGIGVAVGIAGLALIAAIIALVLWRRSTQKKRRSAALQGDDPHKYAGGVDPEQRAKWTSASSGPPPYPPHEAPGADFRSELPGSGPLRAELGSK